MEEYDVVVLGSGEGGKYIAWNLGKQGQKVAVIERQYVGGSCPNIACLPSKNIIHSAKIANLSSRGNEFGLPENKEHSNMQIVHQRKSGMVQGLVDMHLDFFQKNHVELMMGTGRFIGPKILEVTDSQGKTRTLRGEKIIISTGSRAKIEDIPGLKESKPLTHIEALDLNILPQHLLVMGAGYIGLELAQAMRRFGSKVTIFDRNERLAHREDLDVSEALQKVFDEEGIDFIPNVKVQRVEGISGQKVKLILFGNPAYQEVEGTHLLIATGRSPNTSDIGLELTGVEITKDGHVRVNEKLETTAPDIWAVGDCCGSPHFTHIAFDDFRIVLDNINGKNRVTTGRQVPYCMFTDPELARIGLSETEARKKGIAYRLAKIPMSMVLRTRTLST